MATLHSDGQRQRVSGVRVLDITPGGVGGRTKQAPACRHTRAAPEPSASHELHSLLQGGRLGASAMVLPGASRVMRVFAGMRARASRTSRTRPRIRLTDSPTCERNIDILRELLHGPCLILRGLHGTPSPLLTSYPVFFQFFFSGVAFQISKWSLHTLMAERASVLFESIREWLISRGATTKTGVAVPPTACCRVCQPHLQKCLNAACLTDVFVCRSQSTRCTDLSPAAGSPHCHSQSETGSCTGQSKLPCSDREMEKIERDK